MYIEVRASLKPFNAKDQLVPVQVLKIRMSVIQNLLLIIQENVVVFFLLVSFVLFYFWEGQGFLSLAISNLKVE